MGIYDKIKMLCKERGVSVSGVERELGFARGSLCKIDKNKPSGDRIRKLANYFGVPLDYFVEDVKVQTSGHPEWYDYPKTTKYMEAILDKPGLGVLLEGAMELSDENVDLLLNMIEAMKGTNPDG